MKANEHQRHICTMYLLIGRMIKHFKLKVRLLSHTQSESYHLLTIDDRVVLVEESLRLEAVRIFPKLRVLESAASIR